MQLKCLLSMNNLPCLAAMPSATDAFEIAASAGRSRSVPRRCWVRVKPHRTATPGQWKAQFRLVSVESGEVAGVEPTIGVDRLRGEAGFPVVAAHHVRPRTGSSPTSPLAVGTACLARNVFGASRKIARSCRDVTRP